MDELAHRVLDAEAYCSLLYPRPSPYCLFSAFPSLVLPFAFRCFIRVFLFLFFYLGCLFPSLFLLHPIFSFKPNFIIIVIIILASLIISLRYICSIFILHPLPISLTPSSPSFSPIILPPSPLPIPSPVALPRVLTLLSSGAGCWPCLD